MSFKFDSSGTISGALSVECKRDLTDNPVEQITPELSKPLGTHLKAHRKQTLSLASFLMLIRDNLYYFYFFGDHYKGIRIPL